VTKLQAGIVGAILIACVAILVAVQNQSRNQLREEKRSLQERVDQLAAENGRLSNLVAKTDSGPPLADDQMGELLRLRGEVGRLRQSAAMATARLKDTEPPRQEEPRKDPEIAKYEQQFKSKRSFSGELLRAVLAYTGQNQGQLPTTLDQAAPFLSDKARAQTNSTIDQFEIVDPGSCSALTNASWGIMMRERQPWHAFGGTGRVYSWIQADAGRESFAFIPEGDQGAFEKWEAQQKWEMDYNRPKDGSAD
jgi:hypothetical protein